MAIEPTAGSVRDQVMRALDPEGKMQEAIYGAHRLPSDPRFDQQRRIASEYEANIQVVERHWGALTARGWAIANVGVDVISRAGELLDSGDQRMADETVAQWFDTRWIERIIARVGSIQDGTAAGRQAFEERRRLLVQASRHHLAGEYAASILIVLSQIEGITAQVTAPPEGGKGRLFFSKSAARKAEVVDPTDLASIQASLDSLRDLYSRDVPHVQMEASWARHGIAHGQEVAFDSAVNSSKYWSLLDVVVQWAMPRGRERALKVDAIRGSIHAASQDVDPSGRRLDDREFKVTRNALYEVCSHQSVWARKTGHFDIRATEPLMSDDAMDKRGLARPHGITTHAADDGSAFWAQRQTVSGWWLARGLVFNEVGLVDVYYYSGQDAPENGPSEASQQWVGQPDSAPPDWQGD